MSSVTPEPFDSILLVSFGGPESPDDVIPFLENVLRGKNVPPERMQEVVEHYRQFGGVSPINGQNRDLLAALRTELDASGIDLPLYWGNRNWHPLLTDTIRQMRDDGRKRTIAFFTSMFNCYSGCRQYRENISDACKDVGGGAPVIEKLRSGFNHPAFINAQVQRTRDALEKIDATRRSAAKLLFTAHSIPIAMADHSSYAVQLNEASRLIAESIGHRDWEIVYQSRSGPPMQAWLEPDICDRIEELAGDGIVDFAIVPIGFVSDHMEVIFDLDTEAKQLCEKLGVGFSRAATAGIHPSFIRMVRELIEERIHHLQERSSIGTLDPSHDVCPDDCCLYPRTR